MHHDYEYNSRDYIADKILAQGDGPAKYDAQMRIRFYERGDIENATRLKHGLKYKDPDPEETRGCAIVLGVLLVIAVIAIIVGIELGDGWTLLSVAGLGYIIFYLWARFSV